MFTLYIIGPCLDGNFDAAVYNCNKQNCKEEILSHYKYFNQCPFYIFLCDGDPLGLKHAAFIIHSLYNKE